jgi:hypothetical protein
MPRTSILIGGIRGSLRTGRCHANHQVHLFGEAISAHAMEAALYGRPLRRRLIDFGSEGERGPPG